MKIYDDNYFDFEQHGVVNDKTPVCIFPPFAGRDGTVTDNLVKKCVDAGRTIYRYNLKSATQQTKDLTLSDWVRYIRMFLDTIQTIHGDKKIDFLGCCQGGWLSTIVASLYPDDVNKLALFAAPINLKTGCDNAIEKYCETIDMQWHRDMVDMNNGIQDGRLQWLSFAMLAPEEVFFGKYLDLFRHSIFGDYKAVKKWWRNEKWYLNYQHYAGGLFLDILENHFKDNRLYNGTWMLNGKAINLSNITCPIDVYAGRKDGITSIEQAEGILHMATSTKKRLTIFDDAGHTKVFTGGKELEIFSKQVLQ
jgi:poly(3-hydroxyalkanoate) synthetase